MLFDALGVLCLLLVLAALVWLCPHAKVVWPPKPLSPGLAAWLNAPPPPVPNCRCAFSPTESILARAGAIAEQLTEKRERMVMDALKGDRGSTIGPQPIKAVHRCGILHEPIEPYPSRDTISMPSATLQIGGESFEVTDLVISVPRAPLLDRYLWAGPGPQQFVQPEIRPQVSGRVVVMHEIRRMVASGATVDEIVKQFPSLGRDGVLDAVTWVRTHP